MSNNFNLMQTVGRPGTPDCPMRCNRNPLAKANARTSCKARSVAALLQFQKMVKPFPALKTCRPFWRIALNVAMKFPDRSFGLDYSPLNETRESWLRCCMDTMVLNGINDYDAANSVESGGAPFGNTR